MKKKINYEIKMLNYFKQVKGSVIFFIILMILSCGVGIVKPIVSANILTNVTNLNMNKSLSLSLIWILIIGVKVIISYTSNYVYLNKIESKVLFSIRKDMIKNILVMKTKNYDEHSSGEFYNRLKSDPENISNILSVVQYSFLCLLSDLFTVLYCIYINWILGLIYIAGALLIFIYQNYAFKKIKAVEEESRVINDNTSTLLNEMMRGIRDVKVLNIVNKFNRMVVQGLANTTNIEIKKETKNRNVYYVIEIIESITTFLIIFVGIFLAKNNFLTVTNLLVVYMYKSNVFDLLLCYRSIKEYLVQYSVASKRIFELMDNNNYPKEKFGNKELSNIKGKIELKHLHFGYNKKQVLKDINLVIEPNDTIGIVGSSGSGKTTLLNLLSKSYDTDNNEIFIDDIDINELTKDSIRDNISVISQNPYIFNLSIKDNLKLIGDDVTDKDIVEACKISQIHDFIMTLPDKYDSLLGEGGTNLSGGQKQRLAIARALIKKSKIILFDEATSALDNITQNELKKSIDNITKDYTIIIVAHRLSTIKDCNKIYVIDDGQIVGSGTHEELLNNKYYNKLYKEESN